MYNYNTVRVVNSDQTANYSNPTYSAQTGSSDLAVVESATKTTYIDRIVINSGSTIQFLYEEKEHKFYSDNSPFNQKTLRLREINVTDFMGSLCKVYDFGYSYHGGTFSRMFLTSFQERDPRNETVINPHIFTYYNTSSLPSPTTGEVDHWGFWNSNGHTLGSVIPALTYNSSGDIRVTGDERDADNLKFKTALLEKVIYPTLGHTKYYYERHQYAKRLERRSVNNFLPDLYNVTGYTGGARVSKTENFDGIATTEVKEFKYTPNYPNGSGSTGILMDWPRYLFYWEVNGLAGFKSKHLRAKSNSFNRNYSGLEKYIGYSEVTEVRPGNGFTVYKFTDYDSNPDENAFNTTVVHNSIYPYVSPLHLWNNYVGIKFNDKHFERGVPYHTMHFKYNGSESPVLLKETKSVAFTGEADFPDSYVVGVHLTGGVAQSFKQ